jgi:hypothetical protein
LKSGLIEDENWIDEVGLSLFCYQQSMISLGCSENVKGTYNEKKTMATGIFLDFHLHYPCMRPIDHLADWASS